MTKREREHIVKRENDIAKIKKTLRGIEREAKRLREELSTNERELFADVLISCFKGCSLKEDNPKLYEWIMGWKEVAYKHEDEGKEKTFSFHIKVSQDRTLVREVSEGSSFGSEWTNFDGIEIYDGKENLINTITSTQRVDEDLCKNLEIDSFCTPDEIKMVLRQAHEFAIEEYDEECDGLYKLDFYAICAPAPGHSTLNLSFPSESTSELEKEIDSVEKPLPVISKCETCGELETECGEQCEHCKGWTCSDIIDSNRGTSYHMVECSDCDKTWCFRCAGGDDDGLSCVQCKKVLPEDEEEDD